MPGESRSPQKGVNPKRSVMVQRFLAFVQEHALFDASGKILLGVSGGIDSMVMMHLFMQAGYRIGIAHCNYRLRGEESDQDQAFVRSFAEKHDLPFYTRAFDTDTYARDHKLSVQMAARRLRYQWFENLCSEHGYDAVAIGHNKDDLAETFLINLSRGTGLKGLTGIKVKKGMFVRPLLFASREEIDHYSRENDIGYREDSSNRTTKYSRNKIRHQIIPVFREMNPRFLDTMIENIDRLKDVYELYKDAVGERKARLVEEKGPDRYIRKDVGNLKGYRTLLFEILRDYHFSRETVQMIADTLDGPPGKEFYSPTHKLIRDREWLIITPRHSEEQEKHYIEEDQEYVDYPVGLRLRSVDHPGEYDIPDHPDIASVDYDKLSFPLILRRWHAGDYFKPLGLDHFKKLSDFFVDRKYSVLDKERTWILSSGEKIVWILGDRLDERFKVNARTRKILEISYLRGS